MVPIRQPVWARSCLTPASSSTKTYSVFPSDRVEFVRTGRIRRMLF